MVPGFLHGMGNALFAIQAHAQVLDVSGKGDIEALVAACRKANAELEVLRLLTSTGGEPGSSTGIAAGEGLRGILDLMRIGLQDSGVSIAADPSGFEASDPVPHRLFARTVALAAAEICEAVPTGRHGELQFRWVEPRVLRLAFVADVEQLPFEADLTVAGHSVTSWLELGGGQVAAVEGGFALTFPEAADV